MTNFDVKVPVTPVFIIVRATLRPKERAAAHFLQEFFRAEFYFASQEILLLAPGQNELTLPPIGLNIHGVNQCRIKLSEYDHEPTCGDRGSWFGPYFLQSVGKTGQIIGFGPG